MKGFDAITYKSDTMDSLRLMMLDSFVMKRATHRELWVYRHVLAPDDGPALVGASGRRLRLAYLPGEHPDITDPAKAAEAYRWLGALHRRHAGLDVPELRRRPPGMVWPAPAWRIARTLAGAGMGREKASALAKALAGGPRTLVHGDFHRWNLVCAEGGLRALDWEHAACAHPVWDLLLLAPEGGAREDIPCGAAAVAALQAYHSHGLLTEMAYSQMVELQAGARAFVALERAARARRRAAEMPAGPAAVLCAHADRDEAEARDLLTALGTGRR